MNVKEFLANSNAHSAEELAAFAGRHVAWSQDGKRILAQAPSVELLYQEIDTLGLTNYVVGYIPSQDLSDLGGGLL